MKKIYRLVLDILLLGVPIAMAFIIGYAAIVDEEYVMLVFSGLLILAAVIVYYVSRRVFGDLRTIKELNETIKNYDQEIVINPNEYREPYKAVLNNGDITVVEGEFLEINKSNELFKNGKHAVGVIVDVIDERELDMVSDINVWNGDVFLIVEFSNDNGEKYKVKTPAINQALCNYIRIGQKVDVYYDDTLKKEPMYKYKYINGERKKVFYDNFDFYVTNIKGKKVPMPPLQLFISILGYILLFVVFVTIIFSFMSF